jgi:RimJ/RimL family protein N-acetyltransferase
MNDKGPCLESERLVMRRPSKKDAVRIAELANDWDVASKLGRMPFPYTRRDAVSWLNKVHADWGVDSLDFGLYLKEKGKPFCGVLSIFSLISAQPALGYWLGRPFWGQGLMTEAVATMVAFAFNELKAPLLGADHILANPASGRVLEKNGFVEKAPELMWSRAHLKYSAGRSMLLTLEQWQMQQSGTADE